jgi:Flp pilus assembly protein TadG
MHTSVLTIVSRRCHHRGFVALWMSIGIVAVLALCSLAVDYSMVQTAKTELRSAADAAARAAAAGIATSVTQAQNNAIAIAAANSCAGTAVTITTNDIDFGTWDSTLKTFTTLAGVARSNANAVRINAKRTVANGNPVRLLFGAAVGKSTCDVTASSIALVTSKTPALTALNTLNCGSGLFIASYDSSSTTTPDTTHHNNNATIACNGVIGNGASGTQGNIWNDVVLGPSGSVSTHVTYHGTKTTLGTAMATPTDPVMQHVTNPGGVSVTPSLTGTTTTWAGGTYYFTSISAAKNAILKFSGPAVVYLDGDFNGGGAGNDWVEVHAYNDIPKNLTIYQSSGHNFTNHIGTVFVGQYYGPGCTFTTFDTANLYGSFTADTITLHNSCNIFYDEQLGGGTSMATYSYVK